MQARKLLLFAFLSICTFLHAQTSGEVIYDMERQLNFEGRQIPPDILKDMPKSHNAQFRLLFSPEVYVFKNIPKENKPKDVNMRKGVRWRRGGRDRNYTRYQAVGSTTIQELKGIYEKEFIVEGELEEMKWKLLPDQQKVGDYTVFKAELIDTSQQVVAWFAPEIPIQAGPRNFGQLPGLILYLDIDQGEVVYTATNIQFRELTPDELAAPSGAKTISQEKFDELMQERREEMQARFRRH